MKQAKALKTQFCSRTRQNWLWRQAESSTALDPLVHCLGLVLQGFDLHGSCLPEFRGLQSKWSRTSPRRASVKAYVLNSANNMQTAIHMSGSCDQVVTRAMDDPEKGRADQHTTQPRFEYRSEPTTLKGPVTVTGAQVLQKEACGRGGSGRGRSCQQGG
jgi:hypothetical protein